MGQSRRATATATGKSESSRRRRSWCARLPHLTNRRTQHHLLQPDSIGRLNETGLTAALLQARREEKARLAAEREAAKQEREHTKMRRLGIGKAATAMSSEDVALYTVGEVKRREIKVRSQSDEQCLAVADLLRRICCVSLCRLFCVAVTCTGQEAPDG